MKTNNNNNNKKRSNKTTTIESKKTRNSNYLNYIIMHNNNKCRASFWKSSTREKYKVIPFYAPLKYSVITKNKVKLKEEIRVICMKKLSKI